MKPLITFLAMLFAVQISYAQNVFPSSGNTGIGTTSPSYTLDIKKSDNTSTPILRLAVLTSGYGYTFTRNATTGYLDIKAENSGTGGYTFDQKVGIGTTNPSFHLNVDPQGFGGILVGNPNGSSGNYTSLVLGISASQNGYPFIQGIKAAGADFGSLAINPNGGNIGVGTDAPISLLQVDDGCTKANIGDASGQGLNWGTSYLGFNAGRSGTNWTLHGDTHANGGGVIYSNIYGDMYFASVESTGGSQKTLTDANIASRINFKVTSNGAYAKKIYVTIAPGIWPDFVFKKSYKLKPLSQLKTFIDKNQHLPDVPPAAEVEKDGLDVGEMNKVLLKKVEELTLYLIEQNQKIDALQKEVKQLKSGRKK